jgi:hypothetical protein
VKKQHSGVAAIIWTIWCTHNDIRFGKKKLNTSFMQAIFRGSYILVTVLGVAAT